MVTAAELPKGLVYIRDSQPGILRKKSGRGFTFLDKDNQKLSNESHIERIQNLVIPPAWKNVWVSPKKDSYLQATGIDEKAGNNTSITRNGQNIRPKSNTTTCSTLGSIYPN